MTAPSPVCLKNWRGRGKSEHSSLPISLEKNGEGKRSSPDVTIGAPTFVRTSGVTPVVPLQAWGGIELRTETSPAFGGSETAKYLRECKAVLSNTECLTGCR